MSEDKSLDFTKSLENAKQSIGKVFEDIMTKSRQKLKCLNDLSTAATVTEPVSSKANNSSKNSNVTISSKSQKKKASDDIAEINSIPSTSNKK